MKTKLFTLYAIGTVVGLITFSSCKKDAKSTTESSPQIEASVLNKIGQLGFSTDQVKKVSNGYLVEGDIVLTEQNFNDTTATPTLRIAESEQYRTTNIVRNLPRTITVSISNLPTVYVAATDAMISRYNALNLRMKFQRVSTGGQVQIIGFNQGPDSQGFITLGSSGFPTSSGNPYNQIAMNTNAQAYGSNPDQGYITSVLQHEMGHCIGFRHTDYFNRNYSCGINGGGNEGTSSYGAILIPGTPSTADAASFMLACSNGADRSFNANDKIALNYLYK
ncbi:protease [Mucilaginibacter sp. 21P]|uniref:M57 family metalloprotease n=1 Tax=Mucilaginibacter sp. 21P TaxID=2778902 RepID=UPI001C59981A|nr:M57 family metalloprotease [Mucilaginibacter sp. 21P]QXV63798.1 protease [Mucilaginibacter sp. 21P]